MEKSPAEKTDEVLMKEFQGGSEPAFVALMKRHKEPVINFLYRFVGNYDDAVDLGQETFVRLFKYGQTYLPDVKFSTWLYTIASNLARTELKKAGGVIPLPSVRWATMNRKTLKRRYRTGTICRMSAWIIR